MSSSCLERSGAEAQLVREHEHRPHRRDDTWPDKHTMGRSQADKGEDNVSAITMSRRNLLVAGTGALAGASGISPLARARTPTARGMTTEEIVRRWYKAWEKKDWGPLDVLLAENFTFTSAAGDDHISKSTFKKQCWETQADFIDHFEIEQLFGHDDEAFVKYLCRTSNGKSFRNVEFLRVGNGKVQSIECYFGGRSTYPSAVSAGQS